MNALAFQRQQRLLCARDYKQVFDNVDFKTGNDALLVLVRRSSPTESARLGLICAKKHLKLAVDRNLFKRQTREAFRLVQQPLAGYDLIVMSRPGARNLSREQLRQTIEQCLNRVIRRLASQPKAPASDAAIHPEE